MDLKIIGIFKEVSFKANNIGSICNSRFANRELNDYLCFMKQHKGMRPHDIVVLLKILLSEKEMFNKDLASALKISQSEISESLTRSYIAGLIDSTKRKVFKSNLMDFLQYGFTYVFPIEPGSLVRGIPTAHSAPILKDEIVSNEVFVWPFEKGSERGQSILPIYPKAVDAAREDEALYDVLALLDSIRVGKVREKELAVQKLKMIFNREYAY